MLGILQEKVYKIHITDLDELKQRLRMEWTKLDHVIIAAAIISGIVDSSRSVMHVLYISLAIFPTRCYQLDSNLANLDATVEV